jgi:hypothetical protein
MSRKIASKTVVLLEKPLPGLGEFMYVVGSSLSGAVFRRRGVRNLLEVLQEFTETSGFRKEG